MKYPQYIGIGFAAALVIIAAFVIGYHWDRPQAPLNLPVQMTDSVPANVLTPASSTTSVSRIIDLSSWKSYSDQELGFSVKYPVDLIINGDSGLGGRESVPPSITFSFPKEQYFSTVLKDNVVVAIYVEPTCSPIEVSPVSGVIAENVVHGSMSFVRNEQNDAAAGNRYKTITYDTIRNNVCYRLTFFVHGANGAGMYGGNPEGNKIIDATHDRELAHVNDIFDAMLGSFSFIQTSAGIPEDQIGPRGSIQ